jgi:PadR family transcriptional regulator, regulatory protein AphA
MPKENKSLYVVLGILSYGPMSGYDIKAWIEEGVGYFWNISYNQIYPALKIFVKDGLATCITVRSDNRPERKVYSLTDKGTETLKKWLVEPINSYSFKGNELLLKLFFGAQISIEDNVKHVTKYKNYMNQLLDDLQKIEKQIKEENSTDPSRPFRLAAVKQGIMQTGTLANWCDQTIDGLYGLTRDK